MPVTKHAAIRNGLGALVSGTAIAQTAAQAIIPAHASLSPGTGWTSVTRPAGYRAAWPASVGFLRGQ
jgi:hypothetical protein